MQERLGITVQQVGELEEQLTRKDREKNELERSLSTAQQILRDNQAQRSPDWVIPHNQIQLTTNSLGRGACGEVVKGRLCSCVVAVKTIHDLILSPHNRSLFEREMDIASRCRHPCLLQFIINKRRPHNFLFCRGHGNNLASTFTGTICFSDRNHRYCFGCGLRTKLPPPKTPHPYSLP